MGKLEIILTGRIPSKKNSKQWIFRGGRKFLVPSANYSIWHEEKMWELKKYINCVKSPITRCQIDITIFFPDNIKSDLSNKAESIMDLLVDAIVLEDDNHKVCHDLHLISGGVDKENPRAIIIINYENDITAAPKSGTES